MTKKRKAPPLPDEDDVPLVYCWFCEREFDDKIVLNAHQRAKHFTCYTCSKKLNTVAGLQNHLRTIHNAILETVPNALASRSDPATVPDIQGMEGIPTKDFQDFKSRVRPSSKPQLSLPQFLQKAGKVEPVVKKAKVDAPLGAQEIQAQLAQFQKRKEQQEIDELKKSGITFPPGLPESQVLKLFNFRKELPPGTGPYATRHSLTLIPPTHPLILAQKLSDGKSDSASPFPQTSVLPVSSNPSSVLPVTHSSSPSNAVVSKPAPPPSLKFTKDSTILSLSPPTARSLAPGEQAQPSRPMNVSPNATAGFHNQMGVGRGGVGMLPGRGGFARGRGVQPQFQQYPGVGLGRAVVAPPPQRGRGFPAPPWGHISHPPPPLPPQGYPQFPNVGRGQVPPPFPPQPIPPNPAYPGYPPYPPPPQPPIAQPPFAMPNQYSPPPSYPTHQPPIPPQTPTPPYQYPIPPTPPQYPAPQYTVPAHQYPQNTPYNQPTRPQQPTPPNVPFEVLYPMHGKKASDFHAGNLTPKATPAPSMSPPPQHEQFSQQPGRNEVRIITDDFISPEEKLALKYGYGKS